MDEVWKSSKKHLLDFITETKPDYILSMVSGGKDSAASHQFALDCGVKIDAVVHGNTRCGIPETSEFVEDFYGKKHDLIVADAGTSYEDYVLRKGFFGKGIGAHGFAYRILKATPFRKVISANFRQRRRGIKILLLNGARKDESLNRMKNLQRFRSDPAQLGNIWFNAIHDWTLEYRDKYLETRGTVINPVAKTLCRSGECMCGTMQSDAERVEAASLYPHWGNWLNDLENEAVKLHGFGWGQTFSKKLKDLPLFQPMCTDCLKG